MDTKKVWNWIGFALSVVVVASIIIFVVIGWESLRWFHWLIFSLIIISAISSWQIVDPTEVGLRQWLGRLLRGEPRSITKAKPLTSENGIFKTGLHFVSWFLGMRLIKIPGTDMLRLRYEGDPNKPTYEISGTQLAVRSKDRQKLGVDATFFWRSPYEEVDLLILIVKSKVPFDDKEELRVWFEEGFSNDTFAVFGDYEFTEVLGGLKNKEISDKVNKLLQAPDSLFCRCGLFDKDPTTQNKEGAGEAYIRIEYVHVSGPLGKKLEEVQTAKLQAEADKEAAIIRAQAAESIAQETNRTLYRPTEIGLDEWVRGEAVRMGYAAKLEDVTAANLKDATVELKKAGADGKSPYEKKEEALNKLRSQALTGGGTFHKEEIDINSAGQPMKDSNMAAIIGTIAGAATAWASAKGSGTKNPGGKRKKGGKPTQGGQQDDEDFEKELDAQ